MTYIQADNAAGGWPMACVNIDDLLNNVNAEIIAYEAKQLAKFKSELEAFHKKKDSVVRSYKEKHAELRKKWCCQNSEVECLHRNLTYLFKGKWKEYIQKCVCSPLSEIAAVEAKVAERQKKCKGVLELARDATKTKADAAKLYLDVITDNQAKVEATLSANEKWIGQIKQLLQGKEAAVSIYVFWFKLLPAHSVLAPSDLLHCLEFAKGQSPAELCPPQGQPAAETRQEGTPVPVPHPVPWLVAPDMYASEIDCAWTMYRDAKQAHSDADTTYLKALDDVVSIQKLLDALRKDLDLKVQDCLTKVPPMDDCGCGGEATKPPEVVGEAGKGKQPDNNPNQAADAAQFNAED